MVTVLCALIGLGYSLSQMPPTYTATRSLLLRTEIQDSGFENSQSANQANLAKKYLKTVEKIIKSPKLNEEINADYNVEGQSISSSAIKLDYGETSLIFRISYTDVSEELAKQKLESLIKTFSQSETLKQGITADSVQFLHTQKDSEITENTSYTKVTILGAGVGLVISVIAVFLVYAFDNTVKDKKEFEELTGVNVIAYINKEKPKKK